MAGASVGLIPPCLGKRAFLKKNFFVFRENHRLFGLAGLIFPVKREYLD